ncbi:peptidoglycan-binding protein [Sphingomonas sp. LHG3406-1]|uniref:peptidoglycan-binding protein n=1 Tax=Sphingomonas sp. LHG3406-1 TaxID=2804617 RepID=UPI00261F063D|nr:peptidoglycan-binding protein [Sphingomonas sp. LHG3406-1]
MSAAPLDRLSPAARTELIYRAARSDLDGRLWQAALGNIRPVKGEAVTAGGSMLRLETLIDALQAEDRLRPSLSPDPPPQAPVMGPLRLGANAIYQPLFEAAGARTGLDPAVLAAIVDAEAARRPDGRWDPASRNPRSSAGGLGQFLNGTWLDEARRPGSWLRATAEARGWIDRSGKVRPEARPALLELRFDPAASIQVTADHAAANLKRLRAAGIAATDLPGTARAAYLAHHLGLGDALRFLGSGIGEERAGRLLAAQVGAVAADRRVAAAGSATDAHRAWLDEYVARRVRPARFLTA